MAIEWNWLAAGGVLAAPIQAAMAALVFFSRPDRAQNRGLALFFLGLAGFTGMGALGLMMTSPADALAMHLVDSLAVFAFHWGYFLFLRTIPSPLARPLRSRSALGLAAAVFAALGLSVVLRPSLWQVGISGEGDGPWINEPGPGWLVFDVASLVFQLFAIAVAVSAYRRAATPLSRRQMRAYVVGFAVYDALIIIGVIIPAFMVLATGQLNVRVAGTQFWIMLGNTMWLVGWLSYGIMTTHLFDIDLKVKWTIRRGTLAAVFLLVFFLVSQLAQNFLNESYGWVLGGLAAGALLFALAPLQRVADRLADRAMPNVNATSEYLAFRKIEVYKATLEDMLADGTLTPKDQRILVGLRRRLGIAEATATALERDAASVRGVA